MPREIDVFLKGLPGEGAVLEIHSYPFEYKDDKYKDDGSLSDNWLGYSLYSRLYHRKPLVSGYASHWPRVINEHFVYPEDKTLSFNTIERLRKFGAKYWVFHIEDWSAEDVEALKDAVINLKKIAELDNGKTLIYEDSRPVVSVTPYDIKKDIF